MHSSSLVHSFVRSFVRSLVSLSHEVLFELAGIARVSCLSLITEVVTRQ